MFVACENAHQKVLKKNSFNTTSLSKKNTEKVIEVFFLFSKFLLFFFEKNRNSNTNISL